MSKITNIKVLGLALFAVFAFSAFAAASAFAEDEWLFKGSTFVGELETDTEGELNLDVLNLEKVLINTIKCSALFMGTVTGGGPVNLVLDLFALLPGNALIEELEPTAGTEGHSLDCETTFAINSEVCPVGGETLLWVDELRLPAAGVTELTWESLIELMVTGPEILIHFHYVAFELLCFLGGTTNLLALCEGLTSGKAVNEPEGVLVEFNPEAPIESEELACTNNLEPVVSIVAGIEGDVLIKHANGGVLAISGGAAVDRRQNSLMNR